MRSALSKGQDAHAGRWARQGGNSAGMFAGGVSCWARLRGMLRPQCSMRGGDVRAVPCRELSRKSHARAAHLERGLPAAAEQGGLGRVQGPAQVPPHPLALEPGKKGLKPLNSTLAIVHARESAMCWPAQRRMMRSCALTLAWRAPLATSSRGTEGCCSPAPAHLCLPSLAWLHRSPAAA